jgi:tetratricopeptide (TPR) repeat protein
MKSPASFTTLIVAALVATGVCAPLSAQTAPSKWADTLSGELERAYQSGDIARVQAARALAERVALAYPNDGLILHYQAFALYREATMTAAKNAKAAGPLFEQSLGLFQKSLKTHPIPEAHALISSIDGQLIGQDPSRAMELGMASSQSQATALSMGPKNPRVWLVRGQSAIFTPPEYGGGTKPAEEALKHAIELFANDKPATGEPNWGYAEAYLWLGQTYEKMNDKAKAADAYAHAQQIAPNFAWLKMLAASLK